MYGVPWNKAFGEESTTGGMPVWLRTEAACED